MTVWLSSIFLISASAWAIDPTEQNLVDQYIRAHPAASAPAGNQNLPAKLDALQKTVDAMTVQATSIETQLPPFEKSLNETADKFNAIPASIYESPAFHKSMVERLSEECCHLVHDANHWKELKGKIDKRWKEEIDNETEKEKQKTSE